MIDKDIDSFTPLNAMEGAGLLAEQQMAFYLKRRFHDEPQARVINDLRFEVAGLFTQIDHLVISPWGFQVIESKSVTTEVSVNERGEWSRLVDSRWKGMASPLEQAEEQLRILVRLLCDNDVALTGKLLGIQKSFGGYQRRTFVAVSNNGMVTRAAGTSFDNVMKADQVSTAVYENLSAWKKKGSWRTLLNPVGDTIIRMPEKDLDAVVAFLLSRHVSRSTRPVPSPVEAPAVLESAVLVLPTDTEADAQAKDLQARSPRYFCATCKRSVSETVAKFCWSQRQKFGGKVFCMPHQQAQG